MKPRIPGTPVTNPRWYEEITEIEAFCTDLHLSLNNVNFEQQRQPIKLLDVRRKLAIEDEERVVYAKCHLNYEPQRYHLPKHLGK